MKQICKFDKEYNELEYHEIDDTGKTVYSRYTSYYPNLWKGIRFDLYNKAIIHNIRDTNDWVRIYDLDGNLTKERNNPNPYKFATISGVFTNCIPTQFYPHTICD